jgi:molybdopterin/thiamine biosynthesis adenylyltransferase
MARLGHRRRRPGFAGGALSCLGRYRKNLTLVDGDTVDLTNLQRQILHTQARVGMAEGNSGQAGTELRSIRKCRWSCSNDSRERRWIALVAAADVVLDCTDNFATRHAINRACVHHRKPLVSGAAIRFDGQISVYDLRRDDSPCYHCLFPEGDDVEEVRCAVMGVFAPLTGIIGTMQAAEALKLLAGIGESLTGRLLLLDTLDDGMAQRKLQKGCWLRCLRA